MHPPPYHSLILTLILLFLTASSLAKNNTSCFPKDRTRNLKIPCGVSGFAKQGITPIAVRISNEATCSSFCANADACNSFSFSGGTCRLYAQQIQDAYTPNKFSPTKFWSALCYDCVPLFGQQQQLHALGLGAHYFVHKQSSSAGAVRLVLRHGKPAATTFGINGTGAVLTTDSPHRYIAYAATDAKYGSVVAMQTQMWFDSHGAQMGRVVLCRNPQGDIDRLSCRAGEATRFYSCGEERYLVIGVESATDVEPGCTPIKIKPAYFACTGCGVI